jgi:hypothetical protein
MLRISNDSKSRKTQQGDSIIQNFTIFHITDFDENGGAWYIFQAISLTTFPQNRHSLNVSFNFTGFSYLFVYFLSIKSSNKTTALKKSEDVLA